MITDEVLNLVAAFGDDQVSLNETVYDATAALVRLVFGDAAANVFADGIDANDGGFYLKSNIDDMTPEERKADLEEFCRQIRNAAGEWKAPELAELPDRCRQMS